MPFDIRPTRESQRKIDKLARLGNLDLRPTLKVIGIGYRKEVKGIFQHQQPRDVGLRWPELSEKYAEWKEKRYPGRPILVRTGALKASMTEDGARGNITAIGKTSAVFGSSISYGAYHDNKDSPRSRIPLRNFSEPGRRRRLIWIDQIEKDIVHNFEINGIDVDKGIF